MFPADYLERAGYRKIENPGTSAKWLSPGGNVTDFDTACREVMGSCACCGKPNSYPGGVRCGGACNAMHEAKDCLCYAQKSNYPASR
jgi:hypothetical protein